MKVADVRFFVPNSCRLAAALLLAGVGASGHARVHAQGAGDGIELQTTLGTDLTPAACGTETSLDVILGDRVNFCYRVTNHTSSTLNYQSLIDNIDGVLIPAGSNLVIAAGATYQYNHVATVLEGGTRSAAWTAQAASPDYVATQRPGQFVDISANASAVDLDVGASFGTAAVTMPFLFNFYGVDTNQLCVSDFGIVGVARSVCAYAIDNNAAGPLPVQGAGMVLAPFWDAFEPWPDVSACNDLCPYAFGAVYADTLGNAPNRKFVVQWNKRDHTPIQFNADSATFEIIFDEASGNFSFEYADVDYTASGNTMGDPDPCDGGVCATIGVQANDTLGRQFSYLQPSVSSGSGIDWTANAAFSASSSVTLGVGRPVLAVAGSVAVGAVPGTHASASLTLTNSGDRNLNWSADTQPVESAPAHVPAESPFGAAVPAIGFQIVDFFAADESYERFDLTNPDAATTLAEHITSVDGTAFADNDFSRQYVLSSYVAPAGGGNPVHGSAQLLTMDTTTGLVTNRVDTGIHDDATGITYATGPAWDARSNALYCIEERITPSGATHYFLDTIDRYSGATERGGELTFDGIITGPEYISGIYALTVDRDGVMYALASASGTDGGKQNILISIDAATAASHTVSVLATEFIAFTGGTSFDLSSNVLYATGIDLTAGTGAVYTIDPGSGEMTSAPAPLLGAYSIAVAGGPCSHPQDIPWLSLTSSSGSVTPGDSTQLTLDLDASALPIGTYEADVCVRSDDPYKHTVPVRVIFNVAADPIFADGFDGPASP